MNEPNELHLILSPQNIHLSRISGVHILARVGSEAGTESGKTGFAPREQFPPAVWILEKVSVLEVSQQPGYLDLGVNQTGVRSLRISQLTHDLSGSPWCDPKLERETC